MGDLVELAGNLVIEDGKILLLYREEQHWESQRSLEGESCSTNNPEGWWEVPGGKVEDDESPTEAAIREAEEEMGVEVELEKPFFSGEFQHDGDLYLWHGYISKIKDGEPEVKEKDTFSELKWFEPGELDDVELAPNLVMILPALRNI